MAGPRRPPRPGESGSSRSDNRSRRRAMEQVDGARGQRDGTAAARNAKRRNRGRLVGGLVATVLLVGVLFVAVFPTSTWWQQRRDTTKAKAQLSAVEAQRRQVNAEIDRLGTDAEIEAQARRNGYVKPGEESYNILPQRVAPIGLPNSWPFTGVEQALGAP